MRWIIIYKFVISAGFFAQETPFDFDYILKESDFQVIYNNLICLHFTYSSYFIILPCKGCKSSAK